MKNSVKMLSSCALLFLSITATAQSGYNDVIIFGKPTENAHSAFKSVACVKHARTVNLDFTVRKVQNIRNYRIEAGDAPGQMELIGTIEPKINTMLPADFSFVLEQPVLAYKYFRIIEVSMGQEWNASPVVENTLNTDSLYVKN